MGPLVRIAIYTVRDSELPISGHVISNSALTLDKMAKHKVFLILYIGLLCSINLALGEEYAPDPSLEEIKKMDAQEGLDRGKSGYFLII